MPDSPAIARRRRRGPNQLRPSFPRLPGSIPVVLSAVFFRTAALRLFYQGTRKKLRHFRRKIKDFFFTTCSPATQSE
jgi:hypothetical protein